VVRHVVRSVVKYGHWKEYLAATKAWNDAGVKAGLPSYRLYASDWGTFNETFCEAEYEDSGDIERRMNAAQKDPGYDKAQYEIVSHLAEGESRDTVLSEVKLD